MSSDAAAGLMGEGGRLAVTQSSLPRQPHTIVLALDSLDPADIAALIDHVVRGTPVGAPRVILCDLGRAAVDIGTIDALARVALRARRLGCAIGLRGAPPELLELLAFAGLSDVLPCDPSSPVEVTGQPEQREEPLGIEEERDPADPPLA